MFIKVLASLVAGSFSLTPLAFATPNNGDGAAATFSYSSALELAHLEHPLSLSASGKPLPDAYWNSKTDVDGTDLLTAKAGDAHVALMHADNGDIETMVAYAVKSKIESDTAVFFSPAAKTARGAEIAAITTCEDRGEKKSLGRICVTATAKLCQDLRSGAGVGGETLKELETFETRALSAVLTLRGADHQLDNLVSSGNRLGLKSSLQTTRGQLLALAKQVSKELGQASPEADIVNPAGETPTDPVEKKKLAERAASDNLMAKNVLEKSLPHLKENCQAGHF